MGATATAVNTRVNRIEQKTRKAAAFAFVEPSVSYGPYPRSTAGSSNDFLNAPLFAGNGGPRGPPGGGGARVSAASTTPVQADEPMRRYRLTGKGSQATEPLAARKRLNKKTSPAVFSGSAPPPPPPPPAAAPFISATIIHPAVAARKRAIRGRKRKDELADFGDANPIAKTAKLTKKPNGEIVVSLPSAPPPPPPPPAPQRQRRFKPPERIPARKRNSEAAGITRDNPKRKTGRKGPTLEFGDDEPPAPPPPKPKPRPKPSAAPKQKVKPSTTLKPKSTPSTAPKPRAKPSATIKPKPKPSATLKPSTKPRPKPKPTAIPEPEPAPTPEPAPEIVAPKRIPTKRTKNTPAPSGGSSGSNDPVPVQPEPVKPKAPSAMSGKALHKYFEERKQKSKYDKACCL